MRTVWLRIIYTAHILMPAPLVLWHIERLSIDTVQALRGLFP